MKTIVIQPYRSIYESKKERIKARIQVNACVVARIRNRFYRYKSGFDTFDNKDEYFDSHDEKEEVGSSRCSAEEIRLLNDLPTNELIQKSNHLTNVWP